MHEDTEIAYSTTILCKRTWQNRPLYTMKESEAPRLPPEQGTLCHHSPAHLSTIPWQRSGHPQIIPCSISGYFLVNPKPFKARLSVPCPGNRQAMNSSFAAVGSSHTGGQDSWRACMPHPREDDQLTHAHPAFAGG
eukprot:1157118-Pelagomonas_calceolata.AAC.3